MKKSLISELFEARRLDEFTVKDIRKIISPTDLPHKDYETQLKAIEFQGVNKNIAKWLVNNNMNGWECYIAFDQWNDQVHDTSLKATDAANLLMWSGNIKLFCGCPSFKYYGYQYILTQLNASIVPENRFPHKNNPQLAGICCKHLRRLFRVMPFQTGYLAQAIKQQRDVLGIKYQPPIK